METNTKERLLARHGSFQDAVNRVERPSKGPIFLLGWRDTTIVAVFRMTFVDRLRLNAKCSCKLFSSQVLTKGIDYNLCVADTRRYRHYGN